jgi:hypothetical protein
MLTVEDFICLGKFESVILVDRRDLEYFIKPFDTNEEVPAIRRALLRI